MGELREIAANGQCLGCAPVAWADDGVELDLAVLCVLWTEKLSASAGAALSLTLSQVPCA